MLENKSSDMFFISCPENKYTQIHTSAYAESSLFIFHGFNNIIYVNREDSDQTAWPCRRI